jgi:serine phosphatase RsbU (regulator of sigma subunit)
LQSFWRRSPQAIVDAVFADLDRFQDTAPIADDQTLIVMRVL